MKQHIVWDAERAQFVSEPMSKRKANRTADVLETRYGHAMIVMPA